MEYHYIARFLEGLAEQCNGCPGQPESDVLAYICCEPLSGQATPTLGELPGWQDVYHALQPRTVGSPRRAACMRSLATKLSEEYAASASEPLDKYERMSCPPAGKSFQGDPSAQGEK